MFHPALLKLIRLQWYGSFRQLRKSLTTLRGLFFFGFTSAMALYGVGSLYFASVVTSKSPQLAGLMDKMQDEMLPVGLFCVVCYVILFSTGEAGVHFTSSEAAFLFPAPITRKQLLTYALLKSLSGMAAVSIFFALFSSPSLAMTLPRWFSVLLILLFLQLLTMNVAFARHVMEDKVHVLIRRVLGIIISVAVAIVLLQIAKAAGGTDATALWAAFQESTTAKWLLAPFQVFVKALRAKDWITYLPYAGAVLLIDFVLLQLAYRLDALSLEAALATSEKMAARLKLVRSKGAMHIFGPASPDVASRKIPHFPHWGGIGPVLWQQLTATFRASKKLLWIGAGVLLFAAGLVTIVAFAQKQPQGVNVAPFMGVGAMGYMSFLLCLMLQNDMDRVGYLKSLPIRSVSIVLGDLIGFPILLAMVQSLFIAGLACFYPQLAPWLLAGALLTIPLNLLLFGIDRLVFYIYPTQMTKGAPGDFQNSGKQMVFMALKMLILGAALLVVVLASLPGALIFSSPAIAVASAGLVLAVECAALVPLLVLAFNRYDPSVTMAN